MHIVRKIGGSAWDNVIDEQLMARASRPEGGKRDVLFYGSIKRHSRMVITLGVCLDSFIFDDKETFPGWYGRKLTRL